ncbi:MAG: FGGY family carbohydrate kinase [Bacteroidota bacterium]
MLTIGYDLGSSFIKAALVDSATGEAVATASFPDSEMAIDAQRPGWAEQRPEAWWEGIVQVTRRLAAVSGVPVRDVGALGVSYQMHGLVLVGRDGRPLRPAIIWCDSRATEIGREAFGMLGEGRCLHEMLNSPGNFTASKLRWVKLHEPALYEQAWKAMLPGDFIALKMTGECTTTVSGLSEGILWNFRENGIATHLMTYYEIRNGLIPGVVPTMGLQGHLTPVAAEELGLTAGIPLAYRAGDQPNNAFALNVLQPGEIAATAGTSGVVYAVSDSLACDSRSRVNAFAHVNHTPADPRIGILLCINGTGIANSWIKKLTSGSSGNYEEMNELASAAPTGAGGISVIPFGNGAERMLADRDVGAHVLGVQFNAHGTGEIIRAVHEGVAFAFVYGIRILNSIGIMPGILRAGAGNMFQSPVFAQSLATVAGVVIELYNTDGAQGAARAAAVGAGAVSTPAEAFAGLKRIAAIEPSPEDTACLDAYRLWEQRLNAILESSS